MDWQTSGPLVSVLTSGRSASTLVPISLFRQKAQRHAKVHFLLFFLPIQVDLSSPELTKYLQSPSLLLAEDPHQEVGLMVRLEGGGDQQVLAGWEREALRDLPGVNVSAAASLGGVVAEEILAGLVFVIWSLYTDKLNTCMINL